jgi:hypothetical protein
MTKRRQSNDKAQDLPTDSAKRHQASRQNWRNQRLLFSLRRLDQQINQRKKSLT